MRSNTILIVDDEEKIRTILVAILRDQGYVVEMAKDGIEALDRCRTFTPNLAIIDLQMPRMDGIETSARLKEILPSLVTIILTAHGSIQSAVQAVKQGVYDYLTKPFDNNEILGVVHRALEYYRLNEEVGRLRRELGKQYGLDRMIGASAAMTQVRERISQIARSDATVLIEGESGTGKELAARAIHVESLRATKPMVVIDCTSIPPNLIESEFFGYEKGAFTDAHERRIGKFEDADTGTIFLDEVGELPPEAQGKLLRVLQEKEFCRVGSTAPVRVDVRIIAATNRNLAAQVAAGKFRQDLYYRLNVLNLRLPPLREHREDIPSYVHYFLAKFRDTLRKNISAISAEALDILRNGEWNGNVRELENIIQRAMLNARSACIESADLEAPAAVSVPPQFDPALGLEPYIHSMMHRIEREIILDTLRQTNGNRTAAAQMLKISRKTLFNKMQQLGIE